MHKQIARLSSNVADFTFAVADGGPSGLDDKKRLRVTSLQGSEGLSELFQFRVELCSDDVEIDLASMIGKPATLEFAAGNDLSRRVNGIVRSFRHSGRSSDNTRYFSADVVPVHWTLTRCIGCRIHQEHNTPDM